MAKENTFLKNIGGISNAINSVTEVIADHRSGESSKMADVGGAEGHSVKIIDTVDKLEEWIAVTQTEASKPAALVLQQQLQVLKYVQSPAMSGMVIDNIIVCLYKSLELAETDADKEAIRGSVASLLQSVLFMAEARLQYDVKKNKEEAVEMISSAGNLISDSVAAVASMLTPVPGAKTRVMVPVVKNILSSQAIQGGFFAHLLSAKKKQEIIDEKIKEHNTMLENLFATFDRYYDLIGPSIQIHGVLSRYIKQLTEQFRETQYKEIESYTTQFTRQINSMMDEVSTSVKASLGNSMYERVAKGVIGAVAAIANANKKPETLDFNEIKHLSSTLHSRYDALEDKLNLAQKEIEAKEQGLKDAGIFQRSLKSDLAKKIEQLKKEVNKIEKELIDLKEKRQIVDNIIEPVSHKIEEYSANLSRIAERYAIN
jgi:hypothetical protein